MNVNLNKNYKIKCLCMYLLTPIAWQILMRFCKNDKKYYCKISVKFCHTINLTVWFTIFAPQSSHKFSSTILNIHLINVCCLEFQEDFIWMNWKVLYFNKTDRRTKKMIVINILLTHFKISEKKNQIMYIFTYKLEKK